VEAHYYRYTLPEVTGYGHIILIGPAADKNKVRIQFVTKVDQRFPVQLVSFVNSEIPFYIEPERGYDGYRITDEMNFHIAVCRQLFKRGSEICG